VLGQPGEREFFLEQARAGDGQGFIDQDTTGHDRLSGDGEFGLPGGLLVPVDRHVGIERLGRWRKRCFGIRAAQAKAGGEAANGDAAGGVRRGIDDDIATRFERSQVAFTARAAGIQFAKGLIGHAERRAVFIDDLWLPVPSL